MGIENKPRRCLALLVLPEVLLSIMEEPTNSVLVSECESGFARLFDFDANELKKLLLPFDPRSTDELSQSLKDEFNFPLKRATTWERKLACVGVSEEHQAVSDSHGKVSNRGQAHRARGPMEGG